MKKTLSIVLSFCFIVSLFACMSGLPVYAIDNTPEPQAVTEKIEATENYETEAAESEKERAKEQGQAEVIKKQTKAATPTTTTTTTEKKNAATSGTCGTNVTWSYNTSTATLTISGSGDMSSYSSSSYNGNYVTTAPWREYYNQMKTLVINSGVTSIGGYAFDDCTGLTSVTIGNGVTSIGDYAFSGCTSLTSITIPDSITSIGEGAFYGCSSLEEITLPFVGDKRHTSTDTHQYPLGYFFGTSSYTGGTKTTQDYYGSSNFSATSATYYIPSSLKKVTITDCDYIPYGAFYNCTGLTSITIPDSVTSIGSNAFYRCTGLTKANYTGTIADWCNISFGNSDANPLDYAHNLYINDKLITDLVIPNTVKEIKRYAFSGCTGLTSITIPDSVTSIGYEAFRNCTKLTSISIPDSVTSIEDYAFNYCQGITSVKIGNGVTSIGFHAFIGCTGLTSITIPDSLTGSYDAFNWCKIKEIIIAEGSKTVSSTMVVCKSSLSNIIIPSSVTSIGDSAFSGCTALTKVNYTGTIADWCQISFENYSANPLYFTQNFYINDQLVTDLIIPNNVTSIGSYTFVSRSRQTNITIPDSVTSIGDGAFYGCSGLTSISIPDSVTSIGNNSFSGCTSLTSMTIPDSVTSIGEDAFLGCTNLKSLFFAEGTTKIPIINNSSIEKVVLPKSVTLIKRGVFDNLTNLKEIEIHAKDVIVQNNSIDYKVKIICYKGSYAETYALYNGNEYEYFPAISGDTDGDEKITDKDATYLLFHLFFPEEYKVNQSIDFNGDGKKDVKDVIHLLLYIYFPKYYKLN